MYQPSSSNQTRGRASISQNTKLRDCLRSCLQIRLCCSPTTTQGRFLVGQDKQELWLEGFDDFEDEDAGFDGDGSMGEPEQGVGVVEGLGDEGGALEADFPD